MEQQRDEDAKGPLAGLRVVELAGIGPGPFAAMVLADLGADVIRVDRVGPTTPPDAGPHPDLVGRGRRSIAVDLKAAAGRELVHELVRDADVLVEGFRPGVMERLGLGPDDLFEVNPRLVYGRMTGWGQTGPAAERAGHDITYLAITGALDAIGPAEGTPVPPLNLVGDLGGGAMFLVTGVLAALLAVQHGAPGQVVDASIVDGTNLLGTFVRGMRAQGLWGGPRGHNVLDGGAPFYRVYECADGRHLAVGPLEPQFYAELVEGSGLVTDESTEEPARNDPRTWPDAGRRWAALFATRSRDEWCALLEATEACVSPVLTWDEAPHHPHLVARNAFVENGGALQPAPAPRFSATPARLDRPPPHVGQHTDEVLAHLKRTPDQIQALRAAGVVT